MHDYQKEFIEFSFKHNVLCFGEFVLKSGRKSPFFFNTGLFNTGAALDHIGRCYARVIQDSKLEFDMLYGPAYKGIALASATAMALCRDYERSVPYCFNRKENKDHGEGGAIVGAPLKGRVLIIDDVISAGTSVNESVGLITAAGATPVGIVIALDRQERGSGHLSAVQEIEERLALRVISVITLGVLLEYLGGNPAMQKELQRVRAYRTQYGVAG
ncbi:MAG TPA: orotate phosphoribosyltransferase [Gammaproteobacteria bacterium]|nr:orotate phosphoribosyltransferase [Gammaproteobacteria bacterium]